MQDQELSRLPYLRLLPGQSAAVMGVYHCFSCGGHCESVMTLQALWAGGEAPGVWDAVAVHAKDCQPVRWGDIEAIRDRIHKKLAARRAERSSPSGLPPRYDDVYWKGIEWFDQIAHEENEHA